MHDAARDHQRPGDGRAPRPRGAPRPACSRAVRRRCRPPAPRRGPPPPAPRRRACRRAGPSGPRRAPRAARQRLRPRGSRSAGSFSIARMMRRSSASGTSGARRWSGMGGSRRMRCAASRPLGLVATLERPRAAHELVEHDAEREDVAARVDVLAEDLLGRHVRGRAERRDVLEPHRARAPTGSSPDDGALRDAEVEDLHLAPAADEDVRGLDVAMDDAALVGVGEAARHRGADRGHRVGRASRASCASSPDRLKPSTYSSTSIHAASRSSRTRAAGRCSGATAPPAPCASRSSCDGERRGRRRSSP